MEELVEKAKNGDSDAFTNLILNIEKDLYCIAKSKINDENDIDDIIQETMMMAFFNIKKLKNKYSINIEISKTENINQKDVKIIYK